MKIKEIPIDIKTKIVLLEVLNKGVANEIEADFLSQKFHVIKNENCYRCSSDHRLKHFDELRDLKNKEYGYTSKTVPIDRKTKIILLKALKQGFADNKQREYLETKFNVRITGRCWFCDYDDGYTTTDYENGKIPKNPYEPN